MASDPTAVGKLQAGILLRSTGRSGIQASKLDYLRDRLRIVMTKSELIEQIAARHTQLSAKDIELAVKAIINYMTDVLSDGGRIEIRGFGSFSLHYREPRTGRNPKTGEPVVLSGKYVPHFKPGKELRDRVNASIE